MATRKLADYATLQRLARTIKHTHQSVGELTQASKDRANEALAEAISCGDALNKAKALLGYGMFGRWLKDNFKDLSERTAQKYMRLANHGSELEGNDWGLRKAYIALGIIKPRPRGTPTPKRQSIGVVRNTLPTISAEDRLSRLRYLLQEVEAELQNNPDAPVEMFAPITTFLDSKKPATIARRTGQMSPECLC